MREKKSVRNNLIIAAVILAAAASSFTINYIITKKKAENFNAVSGKNDEIDFSQVIQILKNDKGSETDEKNVRNVFLPQNKGVIEIKEKMFIAQVNDVYLNTEDYLGKTIKLEGIFKQDEGYTKTYSFVIRYGPGCCGNDGNAGFEIAWANEKANPYPAVDSWVEATGVLKSYEEEDGFMKYLYLDLLSLNVLNKRGAEMVYQ